MGCGCWPWWPACDNRSATALAPELSLDLSACCRGDRGRRLGDVGPAAKGAGVVQRVRPGALAPSEGMGDTALPGTVEAPASAPRCKNGVPPWVRALKGFCGGPGLECPEVEAQANTESAGVRLTVNFAARADTDLL